MDMNMCVYVIHVIHVKITYMCVYVIHVKIKSRDEV